MPRCGGAKIEWELSVSKDIMRGLRTAGLTTELSGRHCDLDQVFWHTIRPVNDPFWSQHRPGDRWNCKRSLEATDAPVTEIPRTGREIAESAQAGLENNPGTDGRIFSETHPYIAEAYPGAKEAVERIVNAENAAVAVGEEEQVVTCKSDKALYKELKGDSRRAIYAHGRISGRYENLYTRHIIFGGKDDVRGLLSHCFDSEELGTASRVMEIINELQNGRYIPIDMSRKNYRTKQEKYHVQHFTAYDVSIDGIEYVLKCEAIKEPFTAHGGMYERPYSIKKKRNK